MVGTKTGLANRTRRRAYTAAWLTLGLVAVPLVPVPAIVLAIANRRVGVGPAYLPTLLHFIVTATPTFALPAFALGCAIGAVVHLQVNSVEQVGAVESRQVAALGSRPLVASGLLVGSIFAATGFMLAFAWLGMA